jgi:hypothetical protein
LVVACLAERPFFGFVILPLKKEILLKYSIDAIPLKSIAQFGQTA